MLTATSEMVRVSSPSAAYRQLLILPGTVNSRLAIRGLGVQLGIDHETMVFDPELGRDISDALTVHETACEREPKTTPVAVGEQIVATMKHHPWLQELAGQPQETIDIHKLGSGTLLGCVRLRMVEAYPGMFGITPSEGQEFSAYALRAGPQALAAEFALEQ